MKTNYLFPNAFKKPSLIVFVLASICMITISNFNDGLNLNLMVKTFAFVSDQLFEESLYFRWFEDDVLGEIIMVFIIVSGLLFAFSKEKIEDEMVSKIRLESLVWATYLNYAVLIFCIVFIYGLSFLTVLYCNMFTLLVFFIIRFHWMLYKTSKINKNEE